MDIGSMLRRQRAPWTIGILVLAALSYVIRLFIPALTTLLVFTYTPASIPPATPWGIITYFLADSTPFFIFTCIWFFIAGGDLERRWGGSRFMVFFLLSIVACPLSLILGAIILNSAVILAGIWLPLACLTVAWCLTCPGGTVNFLLVMPIPVRFVVYLEFVLVYFFTAQLLGPYVAFFALGGPGLAYLYTDRFSPDRKWRAAIRRSKEKYGGNARRRRRKLKSI